MTEHERATVGVQASSWDQDWSDSANGRLTLFRRFSTHVSRTTAPATTPTAQSARPTLEPAVAKQWEQAKHRLPTTFKKKRELRLAPGFRRSLLTKLFPFCNFLQRG